jgi:hypothetical protein
VFGHEATGKTRAWAETAKVYRDTDTPGTFRVVNWEPGAIDRLSDGYDLSNVEWIDVRTWVDLVQTTALYWKASTPGDWLVVENSARTWEAVQEAYEEHYLRQIGWTRAEGDIFADAPVDESPARWQRINAEYYRWIDALMDPGQNPAHLLITAPEKPVVVPQGKKGEWADDKQTVELFQWLGMRPDAQKRLAHQVHTVLWMRHPRQDEWTITSAKDRERGLLADQQVVSFPYTYLVEKGGWTL